MTTSEHDPIARAIAALTEAARGTKIRGAGTPQEQTEQADFADLVAHVLTSVAANLGGVEALLAGRPGSWEAAAVNDLVTGTAHGDEIHRYRTEPLRIVVDAEAGFNDMGLYDLYYDDLDEASAHETDDHLSGEQAAAAAAIVVTIERLLQEDLAAYRDAYIEQLQAELERRGLRAPIVLLDTEPDGAAWDPFLEDLHEQVQSVTPLPMTGKAPDVSHGSPADAVRRAGLTYLARASATDAPR